MTYTNLHTAVASLSSKLHTFAGHTIRPNLNSFCFDQMARGLDYIQREPAAKAVHYEATILVDGRVLPVLISLEGVSIDQPVEVAIQLA